VDACRGRSLLPGTPDPAEAGTPDQLQRPYNHAPPERQAVGCIVCTIPKGTPDPAEAGTPDQ